MYITACAPGICEAFPNISVALRIYLCMLLTNCNDECEFVKQIVCLSRCSANVCALKPALHYSFVNVRLVMLHIFYEGLEVAFKP